MRKESGGGKEIVEMKIKKRKGIKRQILSLRQKRMRNENTSKEAAWFGGVRGGSYGMGGGSKVVVVVVKGE